ncbi:hypothetical protein [Nocardia sp. NPDC050710]|uniref:hypothetical protein n=1 Tax=Nocardia sp. NPDC050710 TaxID=3157220 RepID=UPI0033FA1BEA
MAVIRVTVPQELAEAIADLEGVERVEARRSSWQIMADVLTGATTTLALLQAPQTMADVARRIHSLFKRGRDVGPITVEVTGPRGQLRLKVSEDTDIEEIAELLRNTIFEPGDQS